MEDSGEGYPMPWGSFPAEKYLVQNWKYASEESHAEQCQRLVRTFLQQGKILVEQPEQQREGESYVPTQDEIDVILRPWRSERLRQIACALKLIRDDHVIILRTHYSGRSVDDETMLSIAEEDEDCDGGIDLDSRWWRVLGNEVYYDFGDAWEKVFDKLPELTARGLGRESHLDLEQVARVAEEEDEEDTTDELQHWACLRGLQIAIVDDVALRERRLKFLYLDANGNIVRHGRFVPEELSIYRMSAWRSTTTNTHMWKDAEIGELYKPDGIIGSMLDRRLAEARLQLVQPKADES